ncbi:MAG: N-acetylneuraminate synthase [Candidatus Marinimicrobia bacterium]|nr:N-acetylneuraminate synthase [Candidatus Neomarinimicrobiota bacterium]|tara:strand:- start:8840 stop:9865 length:1026 start_codon:yes stop_codon:yes gene_type:complete
MFMPKKPLIIAEIGQAHDGSLGMAHSYIDAVHRAGVDGVKFQTHIANAETTKAEPWRIKFSKQDKTRFDYWKRMEFSEDQWAGLKEHASSKKLIFLSSVFSLEAFEMLNRIGVYAWKVASGEINNVPLLNKMVDTNIPIWISTGMSDYNEISKILKIIEKPSSDITLFQCTSSYPTNPEQIGLNVIKELKEKFKYNVGLSDHSGTIFPSLAATLMGVSVIEIHVVFSKESFGPDVTSSVELKQLKELVKGVDFLYKSINNPVDKNFVSNDMKKMRNIFMKKIVTTEKIRKNEKFTCNNITTKKSQNGLSSVHWPRIIQSKSNKNLSVGHWLKNNDISKDSK